MTSVIGARSTAAFGARSAEAFAWQFAQRVWKVANPLSVPGVIGPRPPACGVGVCGAAPPPCLAGTGGEGGWPAAGVWLADAEKAAGIQTNAQVHIRETSVSQANFFVTRAPEEAGEW